MERRGETVNGGAMNLDGKVVGEGREADFGFEEWRQEVAARRDLERRGTAREGAKLTSGQYKK